MLQLMSSARFLFGDFRIGCAPNCTGSGCSAWAGHVMCLISCRAWIAHWLSTAELAKNVIEGLGASAQDERSGFCSLIAIVARVMSHLLRITFGLTQGLRSEGHTGRACVPTLRASSCHQSILRGVDPCALVLSLRLGIKPSSENLLAAPPLRCICPA